MLYLIGCKGVSVASVLLQIWILAKFLNSEGVSDVYYCLALTASFVILCCSLPNYIAIHASSAIPLDKVKQQVWRAIKLATILTFAGLIVYIFVSDIIGFINFDKLAIVAPVLALISSIPTIFANNLFSRSLHKKGALIVMANVLIP